MKNENIRCKEHPDAPHGFDRGASHNADRYVCECEGWESKQEPFCYHDGVNQVDAEFKDHSDVFPLYLAAPQREWVGLTDEERDEIISYASYALFPNRAIAISIEAKLKDKNI